VQPSLSQARESVRAVVSSTNLCRSIANSYEISDIRLLLGDAFKGERRSKCSHVKS